MQKKLYEIRILLYLKFYWNTVIIHLGIAYCLWLLLHYGGEESSCYKDCMACKV